MNRLTALSIVVLSLISTSAGQDLSPEARAQVEKLINIQRNFGGKASSPGAELIAKEVARDKAGGRLFVAYDLYAKGMPQDGVYELYVLPITASDAQQMQNTGGNLMVDKNGQVMDGPNDPRRTIFPDPAPGEPLRLALISKDGEHRAVLSVVPNTIEGRDNHCSLSVVRLLPKFELAFIQGTGFPPESDLEFQSNSLGEIHNGKVRTDKNGYFDANILPFVKDKSEGKTEIRVVASNCKPKVGFRWGVLPD